MISAVKIIGFSMISCLIDIRLTRAYNLLTQNLEMSIQEIAAQVGYEDAYHFSKLFKKKYGVAPSADKRCSDTYCRRSGQERFSLHNDLQSNP